MQTEVDTEALRALLDKHAAVLGVEDYQAACWALGLTALQDAPSDPVDPLDAAIYANRILSTAINRRHMALLRQALAQPGMVAAGAQAATVSLPPVNPQENPPT